MFVIFAFVTFCFTKLTDGQSCPDEYQRLSANHTFCRNPNPQCKIVNRGYNRQEDVQSILNIHNSYRNKVAMGEEMQAGHLPTASNMMQMEWDDQLANVAQKWAENCVFAHDCGECRSVDNFYVGQNMASLKYHCPNGKCGDEQNGKKPNWKKAIDMFYNEVKDYNKEDVLKFGPSRNGKVTGHFTQVVWAKTWRVGCGFVSHQQGDKMKSLFVCNYGPGGNIQGSPMYIPGKVCSQCPLNSCCGKGCPQGHEFEGLCKMNNLNEAPMYPISKEGVMFHCDFSDGNNDCLKKIEGQTGSIKHRLERNVYFVQLAGGQESKVFFNTPIMADSNFCLQFQFRKMPTIAGQQSSTQVTVDMLPKGSYPMSMDLSYSDIQDVHTGINLPKMSEMTFSMKFSVPSGAPDQVIEVKKIMAFKGDCNSRQD